MTGSFSFLISNENDYEALLNSLETIRQDSSFNSFQFSWNSENFITELKLAETLICKHQSGEVAAFLTYRKNKFEIEIMALATLPKYRKQGLQQQLLDLLLKKAQLEKLEIWLEVHEKNSPAIELYKKNNFNLKACRANYYKDGAGALLMKWPVADI